MTTKLSRRSALAALASTAAATATGAVQAIAEPDPIFALIERHRAASDAYSAGVSAYGRAEEQKLPDEMIQAEEQVHAASKARKESIEDLLSTEPTTIAGIAAVLDYVNEPPWVKEDDDKETILVEAWETSQEAGLAFLPMIAATLRRLAAVAS